MSSFNVQGQTPYRAIGSQDNAVSKKKLITGISVVVVLFVVSIISTVFITKAAVGNNASSSSCSTQSGTPKNLIIIIGDGMGQSYNAAYRKYKNVTTTTLDHHFKGRYSNNPTNAHGVSDSAAGATCFASRVVTHNGFIGVDGSGNPKGSILAAAKRQGKGTGIVVTKSVTDATPAAFSAHSLYRNWHQLIAEEQASRQIDGVPMLDVLLGGGRMHFEAIGVFDNDTLQDEYGWSTVTSNGSEFIANLDDVDTSIMPLMGLFADDSMPYHVDRLNGWIEINDTVDGVDEYPSLVQMTKKTISLLSTKYEQEGFALLVEGSQVDLCGHDNDVVCMLWEMEEFMDTVDYALEWAQYDEETLVVILSDHETGGLTIGRDGSYKTSEFVNYLNGKGARNYDIPEAWYSFDNAYGIDPPADESGVRHYGSYLWFPETIKGSKHSARWFQERMRQDDAYSTVDELYEAVETYYLGGGGRLKLTELEKEFLAENWNRTGDSPQKAIAMLMNARTLTGWTTHSHTGADIAVHAYGPGQDQFVGHWQNYEIGELMSRILKVDEDQDAETAYLEQLFVDGTLEICDDTEKLSFVEWNVSVPYPAGNLKEGQSCVERWL